jgi:hypothetical protein
MPNERSSPPCADLQGEWPRRWTPQLAEWVICFRVHDYCVNSRRLGTWLLLAGFCLAGIGVVVWHREHSTVRVPTVYTSPAYNAGSGVSCPAAGSYGPGECSTPIGAVLGDSAADFGTVGPDHVPANILFIAAGVALLIGSIAMSRAPGGDQPPGLGSV